MKNAAMIIVSAIMGFLILGIVLTIGGSMNRRCEVETILPSAMEKTVEGMPFAEAGEVAYPTIRYTYNGMLHRGAYLPGDLFSAVDGMGEERSVLWCEMTDPHGNSCTIESQQGEVVFDVEGIYTVRVCATDEANRRSVCEFQIPVNR